jgi:hypothetical protein
MLLFFRGASATLTASIIGVGTVAATGSQVTASCLGTGLFTAPTSIEFQVSGSCLGTGLVTAISSGFLSRTAFVDGTGLVSAFGGYGETATITGTGLVSATVGSFFDGGAVSVTGTGSVTAAGSFGDIPLFIGGSGSVTGIPTITGGTITVSATAQGIGLCSASMPLLIEQASLMGTGTVTATGETAVTSLATDMRLSFESDEIRLFFRKI